MMINHRGSFYLGVLVFIIPFLGFPTFWKMVLVVISGFLLVMISIKIPIPRKILRNKQKKEVVISEIEIPKTESVQPIQVIEKEITPPVVIKRTRRVSSKSDSVRKSNT